MIKTGKLLVNAATVAPKPRVTSIIGKAQQIRVPLAANKVSQPKPVSFSTISFSAITLNLCSNIQSSGQAYNLELTLGQALDLLIRDLVRMNLHELVITPGPWSQ